MEFYCFFFAFAAHGQRIIYVNANANGADNGTSWANAFTNFQDGVNAAVSGDSVFVAGGTYQPPSTVSFSMKEGVKIYGGFAGTETSLSQRNLKAGDSSILKGNSNTVIQNSSLTSSSVLDGFTIEEGGWIGLGTNVFGGGMSNNNASPTITDCNFLNNATGMYDGGGMYNLNSSPIVINCIFSKNTANSFGGGIYNVSSSLILINCTFSNNTVQNYGGGLANFKSTSTLINCTFFNN